MARKFVSEQIKPVLESYDTRNMAIGAPGLPKEFIWRGEKVMVTGTLRSWRETGACRHGSGEQYARKHWFEIKTAKHGTMKIYFNRSSLGRTKEMGWWIYTVEE